jgi:hypothetical protein
VVGVTGSIARVRTASLSEYRSFGGAVVAVLVGVGVGGVGDNVGIDTWSGITVGGGVGVGGDMDVGSGVDTGDGVGVDSPGFDPQAEIAINNKNSIKSRCTLRLIVMEWCVFM